MLCLYLVSSPAWRNMSLGKLGCSGGLYSRQNTYLTGCPPGLTPSYDIEYIGIWETTATTLDELMDLEDELHNRFHRYRMMRNRPGDSEWFNFQGKDPLEEVQKYMETRTWVKRIVEISEIFPPKRKQNYLYKQNPKNLDYIKVRTVRDETLCSEQEPIISAIYMFIADDTNRAGYLIAPCGFGKTVVTTKGSRGVKKYIICCPSKQIQNQWYRTLINYGKFTEEQILIVGGAGTTDVTAIQEFLEKDSYCVITTYMSSHLLVDVITDAVELLVLDEAHHMAGIVASNENGEGRTRRLMLRATDLRIKRLSLTYTPRFVVNDGTTDEKYLTMDDDSIFGTKIAEIKIRDLISKGILPDYRIWTLKDEENKGRGIIGKAECILEAWNGTEVVRGEEKYILHHLIVYALTTQDAKDLEKFFRSKTTDTLVLRVGEGDKLEKPIAEFTLASRAIIINCFVLNEGVDIPIANSVAIMYPKQSRGQITQMVLRAGRWCEGKPVFHILIPTLGDEDLSGFEEVLSALASCDDQIRDEIMLRSRSGVKPSDPLPSNSVTGDTMPECIMVDEFGSDLEAIQRCFANIRKKLFPAKDSRRIQELCIEKGIETSVEYGLLRLEIPELPDDPRPKGVTWYDYLHPIRSGSISASEFVKTVIDPGNLRIAHVYDEWRGVQPSCTIAKLPSVQHITDGFFGKDDTNFNELCTKFGEMSIRRIR